jgi:hypothetical protein
LKEFSQDNQKYGFYNLPDPKYRLRGIEIKGLDDKEIDKDEIGLETEDMQFQGLDDEHGGEI